MRSQEYAQIHALLREIRETVEDERHSVEAFELYDSQSVRPIHVHRPKGDHRRAIFLLLEGIDETIDSRDSSEIAA